MTRKINSSILLDKSKITGFVDAINSKERISGLTHNFYNYPARFSPLFAREAIRTFTDVGDLTDSQENGLLNFIEQGGGFFGLHTAAASFRECKGYHGMLNAFFDGHSKYMDFVVNIIDPDDPITKGLGDFIVTDELYYLKHDPTMSHHLMQAYDPTKDETHVMAFRHTYGNGRVFFFALGHDMAVLENPSFQEIVQRGTLWVGKRL
ncbi:ThuA domain-containing protein [Candidatus Poribacteria bacterium]|nr:ThuA domain-containing protein [Candidatus Poribacteria bacterium]